MSTYDKGARSERELIEMFSKRGFSVMRAAGSGVGGSPDLLAFKKGKWYAFECKAWGSGSIMVSKERFRKLKEWEENTGITTMLAWRIKRFGWLFIHLDILDAHRKNYTITMKKAMLVGRRFEDLA
ncbi:MAG: Holliday junction resolvase Hjc [Candidatus Micrarchaeia archaeon]